MSTNRSWARVRGALRPKRDASHLLVGALFALLGFGIVVQVGAADDNLATARQSDLVGILDDLSVRSDRLQAELRDLSATRDRLRSGSAGERGRPGGGRAAGGGARHPRRDGRRRGARPRGDHRRRG